MSTSSGFEITFPAKLSILFGGFYSTFGWIFFSFGMLFLLVFGTTTDLSFLKFHGDITRIQGELLKIDVTDASENEQPIYAYHYRFFTPQEQRYEGVSYARYRNWQAGRQITVEYVAANPELSRIQGMRNNMFPVWVLFLILIFPLVGLSFIIFGLRRGVSAMRILRNGILTYGKLVDKQSTNTKINERRVYRFTFEYKDGLGRKFTVESKTHETYKLEDDPQERLIYHFAKPEQAVLVDNLPGAPHVGQDKIIHAASLFKAFALLILPLLGSSMTLFLFLLVAAQL